MSQTQMEKCCECIINVFHQYSIQKEHHDMLSKTELNKLLKEQLPNFLKSSKKPDAIDHLFKELDQNKDQQVCFEEFMTLVAKVLVDSHEKFHH